MRSAARSEPEVLGNTPGEWTRRTWRTCGECSPDKALILSESLLNSRKGRRDIVRPICIDDELPYPPPMMEDADGISQSSDESSDLETPSVHWISRFVDGSCLGADMKCTLHTEPEPCMACIRAMSLDKRRMRRRLRHWFRLQEWHKDHCVKCLAYNPTCSWCQSWKVYAVNQKALAIQEGTYVEGPPAPLWTRGYRPGPYDSAESSAGDPDRPCDHLCTARGVNCNIVCDMEGAGTKGCHPYWCGFQHLCSPCREDLVYGRMQPDPSSAWCKMTCQKCFAPGLDTADLPQVHKRVCIIGCKAHTCFMGYMHLCEECCLALGSLPCREVCVNCRSKGLPPRSCDLGPPDHEPRGKFAHLCGRCNGYSVREIEDWNNSDNAHEDMPLSFSIPYREPPLRRRESAAAESSLRATPSSPSPMRNAPFPPEPPATWAWAPSHATAGGGIGIQLAADVSPLQQVDVQDSDVEADNSWILADISRTSEDLLEQPGIVPPQEAQRDPERQENDAPGGVSSTQVDLSEDLVEQTIPSLDSLALDAPPDPMAAPMETGTSGNLDPEGRFVGEEVGVKGSDSLGM